MTNGPRLDTSGPFNPAMVSEPRGTFETNAVNLIDGARAVKSAPIVLEQTMISYDEWRKLDDAEKFHHLYRLTAEMERVINKNASIVQLLHERLRKVESAVAETV